MNQTAELVEHYADYYGEPSRWREICATAKARNVIRLWRRVFDADPESIVDIGCGDGAVLQQLKGFATRAIGAEVSPSAIKAAQRRQLSVEWIQFSDALPLSAGSVDLAILSHVVEHLSNPRGAIAEAFRIARYVFVEVPLEHHWRSPAHFQWTNLGHINFFTPRTLRWLVESAVAPRPVTILAESVTTPDRDTFVYQHGMIGGSLRWALKAMARPVAPLFTYHGAVLACTSSHTP